MIEYYTGNVFDANRNRGIYDFDYELVDGVKTYTTHCILRIKAHEGYCTSEIVTSDYQSLTIILVFGNQVDIVAVPEHGVSVYTPWRVNEMHRMSETAVAFRNGGVEETLACSVAIATDLIYRAVDRNYVHHNGAVKDFPLSQEFTELTKELWSRVASSPFFVSDDDSGYCDDDDSIPF